MLFINTSSWTLGHWSNLWASSIEITDVICLKKSPRSPCSAPGGSFLLVLSPPSWGAPTSHCRLLSTKPSVFPELIFHYCPPLFVWIQVWLKGYSLSWYFCISHNHDWRSNPPITAYKLLNKETRSMLILLIVTRPGKQLFLACVLVSFNATVLFSLYLMGK